MTRSTRTSFPGAAAPLVARSDVGFYIPVGWGTHWHSAVAGAQAGTAKATVAVVGDSVGRGYYSSDLEAKGWAQLLRTDLQALYGDGGSGFKTALDASTFGNAKGVDASAITYYATHGYLTKAGTWGLFTGSMGPSFAYGLSTTDAGTPGSITFSVRGTTVRIYTKANNGGNAAWSYQIDGGTVVPVTDAATGNTMQVTTITGLSAGTHTVKIAYADAGTKTLYVAGVAGENASGVVVNNHSIFGAKTSDINLTGDGDTSITPDWMGGYKYPADLVIWSMGLNDGGASVTGDAHAKVLRRYLQQVRDGSTLQGTTDILIVLPHVGQQDNANYLYQDYCVRAREIAASYNAALIDFWALGRNSWNYWNTLGYWSNSSVPGTQGTNGVHPSDAGFAYMEGVIKAVLTR